MKRKNVFCFMLMAVIMLVSACGPVAAQSTQTPEPPAAATAADVTATAAPSASPTTEPKQKDMTIKIYAVSGEIIGQIDKFLELHPDFKYTIERVSPEADENKVIKPMEELDNLLTAGGSSTPDIIIASDNYALRYMMGEMSGYIMSYKDLGIDVDAETAKAEIPQYFIDTGTRPSDGALTGLPFKSPAAVFMYRKSIAKKVWGTSKPDAIASKIGPGWDKFFEAAETLNKKGYSIVSGAGDIWYAVENSADKGWIVDGKLYIDPKREAFLDYSKLLVEKGYTHDCNYYTDEWRKDMSGEGEKPVFGFYVSSWMVTNEILRNCGGGRASETGTWGDWAVCKPPVYGVWTAACRWALASKQLENDPDKKAAVAEIIQWMTLDCTEQGLQYYIANGTLPTSGGVKYAVPSGTVMKMSDGTVEFLGGQDMFDVFLPASENINGSVITEEDFAFGVLWRQHASEYAHGECTREEAIAAFKKDVKDELGIDAW